MTAGMLPSQARWISPPSPSRGGGRRVDRTIGARSHRGPNRCGGRALHRRMPTERQHAARSDDGSDTGPRLGRARSCISGRGYGRTISAVAGSASPTARSGRRSAVWRSGDGGPWTRSGSSICSAGSIGIATSSSWSSPFSPRYRRDLEPLRCDPGSALSSHLRRSAGERSWTPPSTRPRRSCCGACRRSGYGSFTSSGTAAASPSRS